jgi:hypothetical protein
MPDFGIMRGFNDKLFGDKLVAGQLPTQLGLIGSLNITPFLLDLYPNASAAYSLRLLRGAYTGSAIRVRRSSDNAESDIGFSGENLDTSALTSFCSGTDGFVTTWYDQSGNAKNVTQTTAIYQPQIVSSGNVININSKPSIKMNSVFDILRYQGTGGTSSSNTMAVVFKFNNIGGYGVTMAMGNTNTTSFALLGSGAGNLRSLYSLGQESRDGSYTTNQEIWGSTTALSSAKFWFNGTSQTITNPSVTYTANLADISIGNDPSGSTRLPNMQECVYWAVTQTDTDLVGINKNQNTYFNVY